MMCKHASVVLSLWLFAPISLTAAPLTTHQTHSNVAQVAQSCDAWSVRAGADAPLYPDTHATYVSYKFLFDASTALKLTATFAHVRFESLTLYDDETGALVSKLQDEAIEPDPGSVNPFRTGVDHAATNRNYTVWIAPANTLHASAINVLPVSPGLRYLTLMLRLYAPETGQDSLGGVPLPILTAYDASSDTIATCPGSHDTWFFESSDPAEQPAVQTSVHFFRMLGSQYYPSYDTDYLATKLDPSLGRVVVLKFRPPTFPNTASGTGSFTGLENMRYWSMCLSYENTTTTAACLSDAETHPAADGNVYLVLARPDSKVATVGVQAGMNLLSWPTAVKSPVLLYRNMLVNPGFESGNDAVLPFDPTRPASEQVAELYIGAYAPVGTHCSERQFLTDYCGMKP